MLYGPGMSLTEVKRARRAIIYLRLSDAPNEQGTFKQREERVRKFAGSRGFEVVDVVIENDVMSTAGDRKSASAFKKRKIKLPDGRVKLRVNRPGFRSILNDLAFGRADAIFAEDLDRVMRDPRDLEDLIDVCGYYKRSAHSVSGSLTLTEGGTDSEVTTARVMVAMANKSSRDTARRVADARARLAPSGRWGGGARPYGFLGDGVTVIKGEADEIYRWAEEVLANVSLRAIAADLRKRGEVTPRGKKWTSNSVREVLLRPRNAGILVYRPLADHERSEGNERYRYTQEEEVGTASWEPIIPEDMWRSVVEMLLDPNRTTSPGSAPRWLGSGIYRCPCGATMRVRNRGGESARSYRCVERGEGLTHAQRHMEDVDNLVIKTLIEMLSSPSAADMFLKPADPGVDLNALRSEIRALRERENVFAVDYAAGFIKRGPMLAGLERIKTEIERKEDVLRKNTSVSPLKPLIGASNVREVWDKMPLGSQREVLRTLLTITILPAGPGNPKFDPRSVRIEPSQVGADQ